MKHIQHVSKLAPTMAVDDIGAKLEAIFTDILVALGLKEEEVSA